jgi:hypothetical protein
VPSSASGKAGTGSGSQDVAALKFDSFQEAFKLQAAARGKGRTIEDDELPFGEKKWCGFTI